MIWWFAIIWLFIIWVAICGVRFEKKLVKDREQRCEQYLKKRKNMDFEQTIRETRKWLNDLKKWI